MAIVDVIEKWAMLEAGRLMVGKIEEASCKRDSLRQQLGKDNKSMPTPLLLTQSFPLLSSL
jgi:hypothetical protein